jgi:hypothetical protein
LESVAWANKSDYAPSWMSMSENTICEMISEVSGTITMVEDEVGSCVCGCSARKILLHLPQLFRGPHMTSSDPNQRGRVSAAALPAPSGASCPTSASIRATCAAAHTPNCAFASSAVRLSVLVSIDATIGQARRPSYLTWLIESVDMPIRDAMISRAGLK